MQQFIQIQMFKYGLNFLWKYLFIKDNMDYKQFEKYILLIKTELDKEKEINNFFIKINLLENQTYINLIDSKLINAYINILSIAMNDDSNWIEWFIFDNDFGNKKLKIKYNKKVRKIISIRQLYNLIKNKK